MTDKVLMAGDGLNHGRVEIPVAWPVTCHSEAESGKSPEAIRKAEQREREKAAGVEVMWLKLGVGDRVMLSVGQKARGSQGIPYTATEYVLTLIRRDHELLQQQLGVVAGKICEHCRKPLPLGCGGVLVRELSCALPQLERALAL